MEIATSEENCQSNFLSFNALQQDSEYSSMKRPLGYVSSFLLREFLADGAIQLPLQITVIKPFLRINAHLSATLAQCLLALL